jgi:hypothetical protein
MLRLHAAAATDPAARAALLDAGARVIALSRLNARLDALAATMIDSADLLNGLAADIRAMHLAGRRAVTLDIRAEPHRLPAAHARSLGLVVNELVVDALKYAFPGGRGGTVGAIFGCRCPRSRTAAAPAAVPRPCLVSLAHPHRRGNAPARRASRPWGTSSGPMDTSSGATEKMA